MVYRHKGQLPPLCRGCGGKIRKRVTTVYLKPQGDGRSMDVPWVRYVQIPAPIKTREEAKRLTNHQIVSLRRGSFPIPGTKRELGEVRTATGSQMAYGMDYEEGAIVSFSEWDGESYEDEFFCKGTCADSYARMMARAGDDGRHGLQSVAYADAVKARK